MSPRECELIDQAVAKLGPERAASALAAFDDPKPFGWFGCVLARAYGERMALVRDARAECYDARSFAMKVFDLSYRHSCAVTNAFDREGTLEFLYLRRRLEVEAAKMQSKPSTTTTPQHEGELVYATA